MTDLTDRRSAVKPSALMAAKGFDVIDPDLGAPDCPTRHISRAALADATATVAALIKALSRAICTVRPA